MHSMQPNNTNININTINLLLITINITINNININININSGCQWLSNGVMRSPSTALSPPSKRRCGLTCLVFNILPSGI